MKSLNFRLRLVVAALSFILLFSMSSCDDHRVPPAGPSLPDRIFYALSDNNLLHEINIRNTGTPLRTFEVVGLEQGDMLKGIDFRPATGQLYAISSMNNLYQVNVKSGDQHGKATRIGSAPIAATLNGHVGFDFNPTVDRIRVVTSSTQNLRLHPETGAIVPGDSPLNGYANPMIGAVAYTNSRAGVTAAPAGAGTTLYDIDPSTDMLYIQNPPNPGGLVPVGALGLNIEEVGGFDISPDVNPSDIYPIVSVKFGGKWELDFVDLATGKLQKLGDFPANANVIGIAIPPLPVAYALTDGGMLKIFNPENGMEYGTKSIPAIPGVTLQGIDIRPANGRLYALGNNSKIYGIDLGSGAVTELASLKLADNTPLMLSGTYFGVDFNPVADRLRVVSDNGQNLRINVTDGVTVVDQPLKIGVAGPIPFITAVAYTNSYPGTTTTTLFDIDSQSNTLYVQTPPNNGVMTDPKALGIDVEPGLGFDIGNVSGKGYAVFTVGLNTSFYSVDLSTGATMHKFPFSGPVKGLAVGFGL
ncbi:hypothetical protein J2Y45_002994 [Dyadobacter sp. BE34]|uniref:DUF4394 domain-containing protein n=1 Tax=Dyadobacter fermentans TaxID=94254 RepID=A0ABU1QUE0_9BACT|nr:MULTISPECIES: DUF4394 domain-containing protein [Dyadobacter]MDR6804698.1 hypothetical protein [Dyadobacter fermentans]MDR7043543.1 hypothetical protein [Dyadobacter sp. BE242]MDR7197855.1 hypothetical protein [Dyadobacter sp. BE34]MDR7214712.1 hypothetical protein [Dyadobacter sp. BE31]MDR7262247.1 hypothetical protein [Dyadobacter sp. BE32]